MTALTRLIGTLVHLATEDLSLLQVDLHASMHEAGFVPALLSPYGAFCSKPCTKLLHQRTCLVTRLAFLCMPSLVR